MSEFMSPEEVREAVSLIQEKLVQTDTGFSQAMCRLLAFLAQADCTEGCSVEVYTDKEGTIISLATEEAELYVEGEDFGDALVQICESFDDPDAWEPLDQSDGETFDRPSEN